MNYAGSKSSVIKNILEYTPKDIEVYREPFIGVGIY